MKSIFRASAVLVALALAGCGTQPPRPEPPPAPPAEVAPQPAKPPPVALKHGGGFYKDDGPGDNPPANLDAIPDAVPRTEPLNKFANKPYSVLGRDYVPMHELGAYKATGLASWYGKKFHGQKTSSGEAYDMYGMTAAHATLPIPSYARVTNRANGKSVVVRVNDRGPFHVDRIIDLSYTAAWKLGLVDGGSGMVVVESVLPGQETLLARKESSAAPPAQSGIALPAQSVKVAAAQPVAAATDNSPPLLQSKDSAGIWLQLGAFGNRDNAETLKARLAQQLGTLGDRLVVQPTGKLFRLQLGPWATPAEARQIAENIAAMLNMTPVVIQR